MTSLRFRDHSVDRIFVELFSSRERRSPINQHSRPRGIWEFLESTPVSHADLVTSSCDISRMILFHSFQPSHRWC